MADTSINAAQLLAELEEVLRTTPPLTTRRHDTLENHAWLGRAANVIELWNPQKGPAFSQLLKEFQSRMAHEANEAFRQIMVLLHQEQHDLRIP